MGCFLSIQQESSLSRPLFGLCTETPRPYLQLCVKGETNNIKSDKDSSFFCKCVIKI